MKTKPSSKIYLFLIALLTVCFYFFPLVLMLVNSFKSTGQFVSNPFSWPTGLKLDNYTQALSQMHFFKSLANSLIITVCVCGLVTFFGSTAAYVVSRVKSKFVTAVYYLMIASMCAPFQAFMIPLVKLYAAKLGLSNSFIPVIYIATGLNTAFSIFLVRGFLNSIPMEIDQAALIDGCSYQRLFFQIIQPILTPIQITLLVFVAMGAWNDYLLSSLFLNTQDMRTLPMMIRVFNAEYSTDYSPMMAGLVMSIMPMLLFYLVCQKQILEGVVQGSIKG